MPNILKRFYLGIFSLCVFSLSVSLLLNRLLWTDLKKPFVEAVLFFIIFGIVVSHKPFRQFLMDLPGVHRAILGIFMSLMIIGQLANLSVSTFPFVVWSMYGRVENSGKVDSFAYVGLDKKGNKIFLNPASLFPSAGKRLVVGIENRLRLIEYHKDEGEEWRKFEGVLTPVRSYLVHSPLLSLEEKKHQLDEILEALGNKYNAENPGRPLAAIEVQRKIMDLASRQWTTPEIMRHVALDKRVAP